MYLFLCLQPDLCSDLNRAEAEKVFKEISAAYAEALGSKSLSAMSSSFSEWFP